MKRSKSILFTALLMLFGLVTIIYSSCKKDSPVSGDISFYTDTDLGITTVNLNGSSASITLYYSNGISVCTNSGCANFTLPSGTYSFTASSAYGYTWASSCTINGGGCTQFWLHL